MTPGVISKRVVLDRLQWITRMISTIQSLPLADRSAFFEDSRNIWTAESCLRRALEALFDLGRHILAKGFGLGVSEYEEISIQLGEKRVLSREDTDLLTMLGGYRNRLVHFYHEVSPEELYEICNSHLSDLTRLEKAYRKWLKNHAEIMDESL